MAESYTAKLTPSFQKDLERLPNQEQERILKAIRSLVTEPFGPPPKIRRLKGKGLGRWRLRIGIYRVRYDVVGHVGRPYGWRLSLLWLARG